MRSVNKLRGGAVFAVLALTLGQVGSLAHALFEEHETCAEHGELIEAGDAHGGVAGLFSAEKSPILGGAEAGAASGEHGHDHCVLAVHISPLGVDDLSIWTGTVLRISALLEAPVASVSIARPVLSIAPKQSPPALA
jgi:hypothetical protein